MESSQKTTELEFEYYLYYHNTSLSQMLKVAEGNTNSLILTGVCLGLKLTDNWAKGKLIKSQLGGTFGL